MIARYTRKEMADLWNDESKFNSWLQVELSVCKALHKTGKISDETLAKLLKNAQFNVEVINKLEKELRHDVIAFTRSVSDSLGEEKKWIHYGLTSTDVVDTAQGYRLKLVNQVIKTDIANLKTVLKRQALKYKDLAIMGRTHGIHAEITTLGLKFALWFNDLERISEVFQAACKNIEVGKISGAVGTFANTKPEIQDFVCQDLGISSSKISTQILQRDRHAQYLSAITLIATLLEKITLEIRHLQRTEVGELSESFSKNQKGSSAMPHKRNPIASENVNGLVRVIRGYLITSFENVALWHERDISHSSAERVILQDATTLINYILNRTTKVLDNIVVNKDQINININKTQGLTYAQQLMGALINKDFNRENAYDVVQKIAQQCFLDKSDFRKAVLENLEINKILSTKEIENVFNPEFHLRQVNVIYKRIGLL